MRHFQKTTLNIQDNTQENLAELDRLQLASVIARSRQHEGELNLQYQQKYWKKVIVDTDFTKIQKLSLYCCSIQDNQIQLITAREWPLVRDLDLRLNRITSEGIKSLLSINWPMLESISFYENQITDQGLIYLTNNCHRLTNLKKLCIGANLIKKEGVQKFPDSALLANVIYLNLHYCQIGSSGGKILAKTDMRHLDTLRISGCKLGNEGLKYVTKISCSLSAIDIYENYANIDAHQHLSTLNPWSLKSIFINFDMNETVDSISVLPYYRYNTLSNTIKYNIQNTVLMGKIDAIFNHNNVF